MKKYLIASVVAMMAFSFAAFAASLNVNAATLQVGVSPDGALECVDNADVYAWFYNHDGGFVDGVRVAIWNADSSAHDCEGDMLYVTLLDEDGASLATGVHTAELTSADEYVVLLPNVAAELIYGVRIGIDQGNLVSNFTPPAP